MDITKKIKMLLLETGHRHSELMEPLQMKTKQSLSNKFTNGRWSAEDLAIIADFVGAELAFVLPDGSKVVLNGKGIE